MTRDELQQQIDVYAAGIEAEITLLRQLRRLSTQQRAAMESAGVEELGGIFDERDRLMAALVHVEAEIKPVRHLIADAVPDAATLPGFDIVAALHRTAAALVATIIASDRETLGALHDAELARRLAAQTLEAGEQSLAAYRRVVAPSIKPSLLDRRG